jgi:hypothetical protein
VALPNDGIAPDRFELRVRFGSGAVAGALLVTVWMADVSRGSAWVLVMSAAAGALVGGLLARHYGDRFWRAFLGLWQRYWR